MAGAEVETDASFEGRFGEAELSHLKLLDPLAKEKVSGEVAGSDYGDKQAKSDEHCDEDFERPFLEANVHLCCLAVGARGGKAKHKDKNEAGGREVSGEADQIVHQERNDST
ncbi:unnamed protein product, partial [marine sediment metagenome]